MVICFFCLFLLGNVVYVLMRNLVERKRGVNCRNILETVLWDRMEYLFIEERCNDVL